MTNKYQPIVFITGNEKKLEYMQRHFDHPFTHQKLDLPEIQSLDLFEIVEKKAQEAYKLIKKPVLVEDTSLTFLALGKLPGPLIKWFLTELGNEGLVRLLSSGTQREAIAHVAFCYYDGKTVEIFDGQTEGTIAESPKGENWFGWNQIFIPKGYKQTWAEMHPEAAQRTYARHKALKKLKQFLKNQ